MLRWIAILSLCLLPRMVLGQETAVTERDRDYLTAFLEDNLSGLGRTIVINGFAGAFSSRATFDELSIADADGVWLTIREGAISWNRGALLSGRVEIDELSAREIDLPRRPSTGKASAEASGFALPELPVGISIDLIRANRVILGEPLFGAKAEVSLTGKMLLEGGEGNAELSIDRIDGRAGKLSLTGSYANATRKATLDLLVTEAKDGIAANLIGIPGVPSIEMAVHGTGIVDNFQTDIALSTDGAPRLSGKVTLISEQNDQGVNERRFAANLGGDITPLLLPEYRDFIGSDVSLDAEGSKTATGLELTRLVLASKGLDMTGRLVLSPAGLPVSAALTTRIGLADGNEVLLPLPGEKTFLRNAELTFRYNGRQGDGWRLAGTLRDFRRAGLNIANISLDGSGRIGQPGQIGIDRASVGGTVTFSANQIGVEPASVSQAVGQNLSGKTKFFWQEGTPLKLPLFTVTGDGYGASGGFAVAGPETGVDVSGRITAQVNDMGRFTGLAARPLGGSAKLEVKGNAAILSGLFDLTASVAGQDLTVSQPELDRLLHGTAQIEASVRRDTEGIEIRSVEASAATLRALVVGKLRTGASDLSATFSISDLSVLGAKYQGSIAAEAAMKEAGGLRNLALNGTTRDLAIGQATADLLLAGASELSVTATEEKGAVRLNSFSLSNPQISGEGTGTITDGKSRIDLTARLHDVALLAPGFSGPLTVAGSVIEAAEAYILDLTGEGPAATTARIEGSVAADFAKADLRIRGGAQSAFLNRFIAPRNISGPIQFDLSMTGPPRLASLSGQVSAEGAQLVAPTFGLNLDDMRVTANLSGGSAQLAASANVRGGGQISLTGPIEMSAPYQSNLVIDLNAIRLRDPEMYDTAVSGQVAINGPATGGALISGSVALGQTEIRIASTGLGSHSDIGDITHINEPLAVRQTRAHAGLVGRGTDTGSRGAPYQLNIAISAPGRIFVRGRGVDAELGGSLLVGGTTDNILPSGQFTLIRGRIDILGKRLTIDEGLVQLQGALLPYVRFAASTESDGFTTTVLIEGEVSEPEIKFVSSPELPEEEVIAHLLFGRDLTSLSAFQALQLASAVATLAGRGGEGIVSKLRSGFGLDDLDVISAEDGTTAVKVGKYLSEKVYTDVTVGGDGKTEINLNLDIRPGLTGRGTLESDGGTGIGIYFEKDY